MEEVTGSKSISFNLGVSKAESTEDFKLNNPPEVQDNQRKSAGRCRKYFAGMG